jgi:SagB-type dehydrogenase family enzyme
MSYSVSPELFFLVEKGSVLLWHCKTNSQYVLEPQFFNEILEISRTSEPQDETIFDALVETSVCTPSSKKMPDWHWDQLSLLFHSGTRDIHGIAIDATPDVFAENYLKECQLIEKNAPNFFQEKAGALVDLPKPNLAFNDMTYHDVIKARKTSRDFYDKPISIQQLSDILFGSFGLIHGEWNELESSGLKIAGVRKATPASGGLHVEEAYITVFRVEGLPSGIYYYRPQDHKLNLLKLGDFEEEIIALNNNQFFQRGMAFGVYLTARLDKYSWKYQHSRTYRVMLLDMGHVSQTFILTATAAGFNTWITGVFKDTETESFLGIDGYQESVMLYVGAGHGSGAAFPPVFSASG